MARDALAKHTQNAAVSSYRSNGKNPKRTLNKDKIKCRDCETMTDKHVWSKRSQKMIECTQCITCWKKSSKKGRQPKDDTRSIQNTKDETGAIMIGGVELSCSNSSTTSISTIE